MATYISNGRGSTVVKVKFRGVSLIRRAVGTRDRETVRAVEVMYRALYATGRLDVLEAIARGRLHPLKVLCQWRQRHEIEMLPVSAGSPLAETWELWASDVPLSDTHRRDLRWTARALDIPASATIADLPQLLAQRGLRCTEKPSSFNHARNHVQAFLRDTVGVADPLYKAVKAMRPFPTKREARAQLAADAASLESEAEQPA
jgi:hypothetical protein